MQTSFRSGILRHQTDRNNNPIFLRKIGGNVGIVVSPDPTILTFIDGSTDYIYTESQTIPNTSQPAYPWNTAVDGAYLYWELNRVNGLISYGSTMLAPVTQSIAPTNPTTGQLWFDTINKYWYRFQGGWQRTLVVFATKIVGVRLTSMSDQAPVYRGTQVGINTNQSAGSLVYDLAGVAIQNSLGQFFTTEDEFVAGVPYASSMRIEALATYAIANNSLAAYSVVEFNDFDQIVQANSGSQLVQTIGIVEEDADVNDRIRVIYAGPVTNEAWDWTSYGIDTPIYVSSGGLLSPSPKGAQLPIARVIGKKTILFEPWLGSQAASGNFGVTDHEQLTGLTVGNDHTQYLLISSGINGLGDVVIGGSPLQVNDVLAWDGSNWVNSDTVGGGITDHTMLTNIGNNTHVQIDSHISDTTLHFTKGSINLDDLGDVTAGGSPTVDNFVLTYNDATSSWGPEASAGGGTSSRIQDTQNDTYIETDVVGDGTGNAIDIVVNSGILTIGRSGTAHTFTGADSATATQGGGFKVYCGGNTSTGNV